MNSRQGSRGRAQITKTHAVLVLFPDRPGRDMANREGKLFQSRSVEVKKTANKENIQSNSGQCGESEISVALS